VRELKRRCGAVADACLRGTLVALLLLSGMSCSRQPVQPEAAEDTGPALEKGEASEEHITLDVWVPCAYASAMTQLSTLFEEQHPSVKLSQRVENVAVLAPRILEGESPDVFMCVGDVEVQPLEKADRVDYRQDFCFVDIGLVTPKGNPAGVHSLKDLAKDSVKKVGIGVEEISVGYYARQMLKDARVWERVKDKVVEAEMPIRLLQMAGQAEVEASLAYAVCLRAEKGDVHKKFGLKLELVDELDNDFCTTIACPAISAKGCAHPEKAKEFIDFLTTEEAQKVISEYGFMTLKEPKCY